MNTSPHVNRAAAIRDLLMQTGLQTPPKEIKRRLQEMGIEGVSSQQISNEKAKLRKSGAITQIDDLPVSIVRQVKALVDEVGSIAVVRRALDELEELQKEPE